jgi:cytochrome c oxidase cbb3-type subunit 3
MHATGGFELKRFLFFFLLALPAPLVAQIRVPPPDQPAADRGELIFATQCAQCHGADARGGANGPDLIRSSVVLHDRAQQLHGAELAPLLKKQPNHSFDLTDAQIADLSQFLARAVYRTLRSGYSNQPTDMLSGDAKAGEAFFNAAGGCTKCHSVTGDFAGIGSKYDPVAMQQRLVFPQSGLGRGRGASAPPVQTRTMVTVTPSGAAAVTGALMRIDDFNVTLQDSSGGVRTFARSANVKVEVTDPFAAHVALLKKYTDADMHNLTAYLESLK